MHPRATTMRVVIAPDSFKGSIEAVHAARAIARGWSSERPGDELVLRPMADGGEGTIDAIESVSPAARHHLVRVSGPDGAPVDAAWLELEPGGAAVVELAATSGLTLLPRLRPRTASTHGLGEAIIDALDHGARRIFVALGGSASTDGGAGLLTALGGRFRDERGQLIAAGNTGLADVVTADLGALRALPADGVDALVDVSNPLLGPRGAAAVFGPQKGAGPDTIGDLEHNLARFAALLPIAADTPGTGAAGGTAFGLLAWGATLTPGASAVGDLVGLPALLDGADAVVTGEGRFDGQSAGGKAPAYVLALARARGLRTALVAGVIDASTEDIDSTVALVEIAGSVAPALADPERWLVLAGAESARRAGAGR